MHVIPLFAATQAPVKAPKVRPARTKEPADHEESVPKSEEICQVVLHNDDHNEAGYVAECLIRVFGHPEKLALKIMMEAHRRGRSIAEVESETPAIRHRDELRSLGLSSTVEKV
jgi:ATP-dependent Clp protease adapter protein ClpS